MMQEAVSAWDDITHEAMPFKRARTESADRVETASTGRLSQSPSGDSKPPMDEGTPHTTETMPGSGDYDSGLSPDSVEPRESSLLQVGDDGEEEGLLMVAPRLPVPNAATAAAVSAVVDTLTAPDAHVSSTALRVLASRSAAKPRVNKSVVTLHSLEQLECLLATSSRHASRRVVQPAATLESPAPLQLYAGETIMVLVHQGRGALDALVNEHTSAMSMMRIFTLDVTALPPQDYEMTERRSLRRSSADAADAPEAASPAVNAASDNTEDDGETTLLIPPSHPHCLSSPCSVLLDLTDADSLSNQLQHAMDPVVARLARLFQVDTTLCPWLSFGLDGGDHGGSSATTATQKAGGVVFPLPAMVVWRAAGAPHEEYPPAPPQTYSSQPQVSQASPFPDRMSLHGGPLVVKEVHTVEQVHSLSLWQPVYTLPHLLHTIIASIRAHPAHRTGDTARGRSVIYLGASWCPPCMRIVGELPLLTADGLPPTVHTWMKADMDFAKPIFDFFKVEIIPTFIVLDNAPLLECDRALGTVHDKTARKQMMEDAFTKADLGHLQNSSRPIVSLFVEKHSSSLSFEEDF